MQWEAVPHLYLEASVEEETLKKVVWHSVATALASMVFPVPGGPNISTPCTARKFPHHQEQQWVILKPSITSRCFGKAEVSP